MWLDIRHSFFFLTGRSVPDVDLFLGIEIHFLLLISLRFSINSQTGKIYAARPLDYSKADVHHFVVLAKDKGGESSRQSRTLVQVLVIEVKRPTTRILTTIKASTTRAPTTRTLENSISETRRRTVIEQDVERTKSASARTVCFQSIALLFITLILSLRALVT